MFIKGDCKESTEVCKMLYTNSVEFNSCEQRLIEHIGISWVFLEPVWGYPGPTGE